MKIQQGDVIIKKCSKIPASAKRVKRSIRGFVLAEGEATGHAHVIIDNVEVYEADGVLYLKNSEQVSVRHEEHKPVTLSPGIWKVEIVKEYDPFKEEARKVMD